IHLAGTISVDHISRLDDLSALLVFYDWWQTTDYSLNDLEFITGGQVKKSEAYPDASGISRRLIQNIKVEQALTFSDTVFAFLEGVTEEQSQKVIAQNLGAFVETPGAGYRVSTSFGPNTPINIPRNISAKEKQIRHLLIPYHTPGRPAFVDRIFMAIAGVTEEQSRAIVEANLAAIDKACGIRYRVSESFDPKADPNMTINIPESISGTPKEISKIRAQIRDLLSTYFAPGAVFDDNLFTAIDNVTEEQSRANLAENPELIISVPMEHTYWLTAAFPGSSLTIPKGTPITKPNAKSLLSTYHALEVIPNHIAGELGIDVEKTKGLIGLAGIDLTESIFANALQEGDPDGVILNLIETLLPFNVLFKNEAFDSNALNFISNHPGLFSDIDFDDVAIENIRMLFIYQGFLAKGDGEKNREQLHDLLLAFNAGRFYPESDDGETKTEREDRRNIQTALAQTLDAESGLVITAHEEIKLPDTVLEALVKLERCIELSRHLGVGCEVLKLIVSNDYEKLNRAANAIITAFRTKYEDEEKW
ncbi:MAG: hypothetical protein KAR13_01460, partial [Desulfobulbaceae bacterium]|nr:hypothetical protein [Desulfobulbaceae bacterium]